MIAAALAGLFFAAATATEPAPASYPRPRALWSGKGEGISVVDGVPIDAQGRLFLFDARARVPFAVRAATGERLWTAQPDPSSPPANPYVADDPTIALSGETVLVIRLDHLAAHRAADGKLLWSRSDLWGNYQVRGEHILFKGAGTRELTLIHAATGAVVFSPQNRWAQRPQEKDAQIDLGTRTLLVSSPNGSQMKGYLPGRSGPLWETALPPDPSIGARHTVPMLFAAGAVISLGGPIVAIDELTGQILWQRRDTDRYDASVSGDRVWLSNHQRVIALHARTGQELERYTLPSPPHRGAAYRLVVSPQRLALVEANARTTESEDGFLLTWTRKAPAPRLLSRPAGTDTFALLGDVLLAASTRDGQLVAVDLARESPPLARLPPAHAAAEVLTGTIERIRDRELQALPDLGPHLVERLRQSDDPAASSALRYLAVHPIPEALPVLLSRLPRARDNQERDLILAALAGQDDLRASQALVAAVRAPGAGDPRAWKGLTMPAAHAQEQLWRTGRASRLGLCPHKGTRPLPPATGDSIGTAHPLLFQAVAPDGRWTVVCQARADTDGDGKIAVRLGQHGEPWGDAVRPYLVVGAGPGLATDEVLASDPSGRYVAVRDGACLELVDTRAGTVTNLPDADVREGDAVFGPSRAASLDAAGQQLAYLRGGSPRGRVVVRHLADGREVEIDPGPGNLYRAPLDPGGRWLLLELAEGQWPSFKTSLADRTCRGPALSWSVWGRRGGTLARKVAPAAGGPPREVPGLVRPFGADFLVREPSGELAVVTETGKKVRTLVPARCQGRLLHADAPRGLALVVCAKETSDESGSLELHGAGRPVALGETLRPDEDSWQPGQPRYVELESGGWVDLETRTVVKTLPLAPGEARRVYARDLRQRGVHAVRADGAELTGPTENNLGPLRWRRGN